MTRNEIEDQLRPMVHEDSTATYGSGAPGDLPYDVMVTSRSGIFSVTVRGHREYNGLIVGEAAGKVHMALRTRALRRRPSTSSSQPPAFRSSRLTKETS